MQLHSRLGLAVMISTVALVTSCGATYDSSNTAFIKKLDSEGYTVVKEKQQLVISGGREYCADEANGGSLAIQSTTIKLKSEFPELTTDMGNAILQSANSVFCPQYK